MFFGTQSRPSAPRRAVAALCVLLVLALCVLSSSPGLHGMIHGHEHAAGGAHGQPQDDGDDGCVVTLFAQGVALCLAILALAQAGRTARLPGFALPGRILPEAPGFLHLPPQAPPARSA